MSRLHVWDRNSTNQSGECAERIGSRVSKHVRLVCWWLVYRVDPARNLIPEDETAACAHAKMPLERWEATKSDHPREWEKVLSKRARRRAWLEENGTVPDGWTPPDPSDGRTANRPISAYLARRGM